MSAEGQPNARKGVTCPLDEDGQQGATGTGYKDGGTRTGNTSAKAKAESSLTTSAALPFRHPETVRGNFIGRTASGELREEFAGGIFGRILACDFFLPSTLAISGS